MGYLSKTGIVGQYKGLDVYVINHNQLEPYMKNDGETIYAVRCDGLNYLRLVMNGQAIGTMEDSGRIDLFPKEKRRDYQWPQREEPKSFKRKAVPKEPQPAEIRLEKLVLDTSNGYSQYSKVVDGFFEGLEKLWQEIEV